MTISNFSYEKKKRKVSKVFSNKGWKVYDYAVHENAHNVYFCNMETGEQFISALILNKEFSEARKFADKYKNDMGETANYLCDKNNRTKEETEFLQQAVAMWVMTTKSFKLSEAQYPITEFSSLVIFYKGANKDVFIRPVCFPVKQATPVSPEDIFGLSSHAMDIDRQNHPERFYKKAEVIKIK